MRSAATSSRRKRTSASEPERRQLPVMPKAVNVTLGDVEIRGDFAAGEESELSLGPPLFSALQRPSSDGRNEPVNNRRGALWASDFARRSSPPVVYPPPVSRLALRIRCAALRLGGSFRA